MPHIDEGILHAYLDGALDALSEAGELPDGMTSADVLAHLRACRDCATRVETERAVREGAGAIMRDAAPAVIEAPGLPIAAPRRRRLVPLSWAASLLLAAGAGWWSSEILRSPEYADLASVRETAPPAGDPAIPAAIDSAEAVAPDAALQPLANGASRGAPTSAGRSAADRDAGEAQHAPPASAEVSEQQARRERRAERAEPAGNVVSASRPPPAVAAPVREPESARVSPPQAAPARSFLPDTARQLADAAALDAAQRMVSTGAGASALDSALARERAGTLAFETVSRTERSARGAGAWIIRDAAITEVALAESDGYRLVRVRQRLASAEPIVVLTWLPQAAPAVTGLEMSKAAEPAPTQQAAAIPAFTAAPGSPRLLVDGRRELRLRAADAPLWLVLRADLSSEQLMGLLSRLERLPR